MAATKVDMTKVLEFLMNSKEPVTKGQIIEATGYTGDFKYCIKTLKAQHEELETVGQRAGAAYIWKPSKPIYSEMKNNEGYADKTAGKAIAHVMTENNGRWPMRQRFGEVWSVTEKSQDKEGILVVSAKGGTVLCYKVYRVRKRFMNPDYIVSWADKNGWHYISTLNIENVSDMTIAKKLYELDTETKKHIRGKIVEAFGTNIFDTVEVIKEVEKPVEVVKEIEKPVEVVKEVEKLVEVEKPVEVVKEVEKLVKIEIPVEKIVERPTDPREIEIAVLKAKNEIYEQLIFGAKRKERSSSKDEVIAIADFFDDFLDSHGIVIPNEDREDGNDTPIYGEDWEYVVDGIYNILKKGLA